MDKAKHAGEIIKILKKEFSRARVALNFSNPFELLIATILSAQATDKLVNSVTEELFEKYKGASDFASAPLSEIEESIKKVNFFRNKAKSIKGCATVIARDHAGAVPQTLEGLVRLPGVGRKTANIVLAEAFGKEALAVDRHVKRVSARLGLSSSEGPDEIEKELCAIVPAKDWASVTRLFTLHGRKTCHARNPECAVCRISGFCAYFRRLSHAASP